MTCVAGQFAEVGHCDWAAHLRILYAELRLEYAGLRIVHAELRFYAQKPQFGCRRIDNIGFRFIIADTYGTD